MYGYLSRFDRLETRSSPQVTHGFKSRFDPLRLVLGITPSLEMLGLNALRCFRKSWNGSLGLAFGSDRIAHPRERFSDNASLLTRLSKRHETETTKAKVTAATVHDGTQQPAFGAGLVNDQVQAIAVAA